MRSSPRRCASRARTRSISSSRCTRATSSAGRARAPGPRVWSCSTPGLDIYPWLNRFDALVTDYSSIMFDHLLTGRPVLTLDLEPGAHQNFEPDYSLVPEGEFRKVFTPQTFASVLKDSLFEDRHAQERLDYAARLFETDPAAASATVMSLVDALVEDLQQPDWQVITA